MNGYKQFFKTAQDVKRPDGRQGMDAGVKPRPVPFKVKSKPVSAADNELRLRRAVGGMKRAKAPFPWRAVASFSAIMMGLGFYISAPDVVEGWYHRFEISALGSASAAEEKAKPKAQAEEKTAAKARADGASKNPDDPMLSAQDVNHFEKLKQRKEELDLREKELTQLEEELQRQKVELDKRITQLEEMRGQIAQILKDRVEVDQEKVTKLVDLYSNMKPKQAAEVLGSINEDLAVEVLAKMKKKSAAEIMNLLTPDKSKVLSEKYTGYRRSHASVSEGKGI
jgi:flagellar motility protein MotE (MotC chaperone)